MSTTLEKRKRTDMATFKPRLEKAWVDGMTDYSSPENLKRIKQLAAELEIPERRIKVRPIGEPKQAEAF